jgi:hypothetical protein
MNNTGNVNYIIESTLDNGHINRIRIKLGKSVIQKVKSIPISRLYHYQCEILSINLKSKVIDNIKNEIYG